MTDTASPTPAAPLTLAEQISRTVAGMIGVHRLGTPVSRLATAVLRDAGRAEGVRVAEADGGPDGRDAVLVEIALVAEYPARIDALCEAVREQAGRLVRTHGHALAGVDVDVVDVHGPFDPLPGEEPSARAAAAVRGAAASVGDGAKELSATVRDRAGEVAETARARAAELAAAVRDGGSDATPHPDPHATGTDDATARISAAAATAAAAEARAIAEESGGDRAEVDVEIHVDAIAGPNAEGDAQAIAEATPAHPDDARAEGHPDGARVTVEDDAEAGAGGARDGER